MHVDISLLGGFAVVVDGRAVAAHAWTRRSAATLVKVLALRPGRQLPREQLVDLLWPDLLLEQAAPRLHKAAHYARAAVGVPSAVVLAGDVVSLLPDVEVAVDVERFDRAAGDPSSVGEAIDLYRGDLLPEDLYEPWADAERERLRVSYLELLRSAGRWADLVAAEPLDEEAHLRLVQQHVEGGSRSQALRQLEAMARTWRDELGAEPGPAARALHARAQAMPPVEPPSAAPGCERDPGAAARDRDGGPRRRRGRGPLPARGAPAGDAARHRRGRQDPAGGRGGARLGRGHLAADLLRRPHEGRRPGTRRRAGRERARHPLRATTPTWCRCSRRRSSARTCCWSSTTSSTWSRPPTSWATCCSGPPTCGCW